MYELFSFYIDSIMSSDFFRVVCGCRFLLLWLYFFLWFVCYFEDIFKDYFDNFYWILGEVEVEFFSVLNF